MAAGNIKCQLEAVVWRCSVKKLFLEISQNSQENTMPDSGTGVFL